MIGDYRFGTVEIDGETYDHDVIYHQGRVSSWWRRDGHKVQQDDVAKLLEQKPEVVVIGTGAHGAMQLTDEARNALEDAGIEVVVADTGKAAARFNEMIISGRNVAFAAHLTC